ncbi:hypothetical protein AB4298_18380 [Shewanella sp. 10N.261.52.F9]|nr:hypothetical protein [Shewanella marinintestina]
MMKHLAATIILVVLFILIFGCSQQFANTQAELKFNTSMHSSS